MNSLGHAKIALKRSVQRGHSNLGWLNTYHSFPFASHPNISPQSFGSLRVLNEDRVAPNTGFPTHSHSNYEIFSYIISGELTHRDSIKGRGDAANASKDDYFVMKRGDVQFTTGGTGIAHSEQNENAKDTVHFLQIWVRPWAQGLPPTYHTSSYTEEDKRKGFVDIISPLRAGKSADADAEKAAVPAVPDTIPIHADLFMGASIVPSGESYPWMVGSSSGATKKAGRNVFVHLPMTKGGNARIRLDGRDDSILEEGDGAFVTGVNEGDQLYFENVGSAEAEVVVLDSD